MYPYPRSRIQQSLPDDAESLQTDTMRFLALMVMCFMLVFALIPAIPMAPVKEKPTIENQEDPRQRIPILIKESEALKAELEELKFEIEFARNKKTSVEKQFLNFQEHLESAGKQVRNMEDRLNKNINKLAEINRILLEKGNSLSKITTKIDQEQNSLEQIKKQIDELKKKLFMAPTKPESSVKKKGLILRFESDVAMLNLLKTSTIYLYAFDGKACFQLHIKNNQIKFYKSAKPLNYNQMTAQTVPNLILNEFKKSIAKKDLLSLDWGVVLSKAIIKDISKITKHQKNGNITITASGKVVFFDQ